MARTILALLSLTIVAGSVAAVEAMSADSHSRSKLVFAVRAYDPNSAQRNDGWETAPITK